MRLFAQRLCLFVVVGLAVVVGGLLLTGGVAMADELGEPVLSEAQEAYITDQAGNVLYEKNAEQEMPMASITKIMTAIVALDSGKSLDDVCTITVPDLQEDAQMAGYTETDTPTFGELMRVMLVYSANDAAYNIAVNVAGSEDAFVDLMNQKAQELGMTHTHFSNPHGLAEDDHYSCAKDLVTMGRYALENYPLIAQLVSTESTTGTVGGQQVTFNSTDELLGQYQGARGIKTGTVETGTCFLGASERNNVQLFTCVLGCTTNAGRFNDTKALWDWAYSSYNAISLGNSKWLLGLHSYAYNFAFKVAYVAQGDYTGLAWPEGSDVSYTMVSPKTAALLDVNTGYGWSAWKQDGRTLGYAYYGTKSAELPASAKATSANGATGKLTASSSATRATTLLHNVSAWPIFELPLFYSASELGMA